MRLFYAVILDRNCKAALEAGCRALGPYLERGRFTRTENLHLTLVFLGEADLDAAKSCLHRLRAVPFEIAIAGLGRFRQPGGDVLWAGVQPIEGLLRAQKSLEDLARQAGFPVEDRPYRPHLTLARRVRLAPGTDLSGLDSLLPSRKMQVSAVSLMESRRENGRLRYVERDRKSLKP